MAIDKDLLGKAVSQAYADSKAMTGGANASYIPYLASVPSNLFGLALVTASGEVFTAGDAKFEFAIESISKVFTMALAMEEVGTKVFREKIGADPTGEAFNSVIALELHGDRPLSPLVNAGAIATTSLITAKDKEDRYQKILGIQSAFAGRSLSMSTEVNASEQSTNFHNRALAWLMQSAGAMYSEPMDAVDVYTRQCSTLITAVDLAIMGGTLAAGGVNPLSGERVIKAANVPPILAEMMMEGLYTASGDWAYTVGLPGKSGVGGGILAVMPGRYGIAAFSPPLDAVGNSVRGQFAVSKLVEQLGPSLFRPA
ncbi:MULTISPECIES: glutaminase A [unclassified Chelatococcus]|uniref:glutaminase A n=1 Tax=unclassified Chelatococcus TaxID=2638111 RepID=UPI001BCEDBCC|nr:MULTISPECIES: glutaminase A [unclassified Chelatococcus]MBS7742407.1 glutaminase A [Chelatococcus sp. HY11]MBX3542475.1 glutaminase A [Chelatococcus sp.]MCO5075308.1 glutaminase A [Chelatococcus sp.]